MEKPITIFTDGSSKGNPGRGGFGAVIVYNDRELKVETHPYRVDSGPFGRGEKLQVKELGGREAHTTNNRMELQAAISALSFVSNVKGQMSIVLHTDSSYVINGITKWVFGWQKNGWKTATKKEVENRDLWEALAELTRKYTEQTQKKIEWKQVGGHVGVTGNERCDEIATAFADGETPELYSGVLENYRIRNILDIRPGIANPTKFSGRKPSGAKAYSYVSLVDGEIKIHKTWAECEARVKGEKARFKKALSKEDEAEIIASMRK